MDDTSGSEFAVQQEKSGYGLWLETALFDLDRQLEIPCILQAETKQVERLLPPAYPSISPIK